MAADFENDIDDSKEVESQPSSEVKGLDFETHVKFTPQHIPTNSRSFSHVLRPNYEKFAPRCDMTETVFFNSSQEVSHSKPLDISFHLSDQISSFRVSCNIISKSGKIASSSDLEIKSSKGVYS
jgi:hypothetical protein